MDCACQVAEPGNLVKELNLTQEFQFVRGTYNNGGKSYTITDGRLRGSSISFNINGEKYTGTVSDKIMKGTVTNDSAGTKSDWFATQ
jgi:hypothetical protein